jgi:predicted phosphodiesterase
LLDLLPELNLTTHNFVTFAPPKHLHDRERIMASFPSDYPSFVPSMLFDSAGSFSPTIEAPVFEPITFFAIGDAPYYEEQAKNLAIQMQNIPADADFIIHIGDMRNASIDYTCRRSEYEDVADTLKLSPIPVFIVLGDNDWNDCDNSDDAYGYWKDEFLGFESRHWNHNFKITHQDDVEENFSFVHKGSLFMGLNMVGRSALGQSAWEERMTSQSNWVIQTVRDYRQEAVPGMERVFLFGHANPRSKHDSFFDPLKEFIRDELDNAVPFLYLHGDEHEWLYAPDFLNQESFLRIMVTGGTDEPPLKFVIDSSDNLFPSAEDAFPFYRDLDNATRWNELVFSS